MNDSLSKLQRLFEEFNESYKKVTALAKDIEDLFKQAMQEYRFNVVLQGQGIDLEDFNAFMKRPVAIIPTERPGEYIVAAPKFLKLQLGWLEASDEAYNYFRVNSIIGLVTPLPDFLKGLLKLPQPISVKVVANTLIAPPEAAEKIREEFKKYISEEVEPGKFIIKAPKYFNILAALVDRGILPYAPKKVDPKDLRKTPSEEELSMLYSWQRRAWEAFLKTGNIFLVWYNGTGKTWFMAWVASKLRGKILIVVPTRTLRSQWKQYLEAFNVEPSRYTIITYASAHKYRNKKVDLLILDEAHRAPADKWAIAAMIPSKYRIAATATPWREDGRERYLYAIGGQPVPMTFEEAQEVLALRPAKFIVHIVKDEAGKIRKAREIYESAPDKKTLIFSDSIRLGKRLANIFGTEFVYGETPEDRRLKLLREQAVSVVSRVGDMGVSLPTVDRIIEVDFLGRSRTQEGQRYGRLLHATKAGEHHIIMTEEEFNKFSWRLIGAMNLGASIKVEKDGKLMPLTAVTVPRRYRLRAAAEPKREAEEKVIVAPSREVFTPSGEVRLEDLPLGLQRKLKRMSSSQRRFILYMLNNPDQEIDAETLAYELGFSSKHSFRSSVKPSKLLKQFRWIRKVTRRGRTYYISAPPRTLFKL